MKTPMKHAAPIALAAAALAALASPILAQQRGGRLPEECRAEIVRLCGAGGRAGLRTCLAEQAGALSEGCRSALAERVAARERGGAGRAGAERTAPTHTLNYGADSLQSIDLWVPAGARNAALVLFVHGGGWQRGSKNASSASPLSAHLMAQGHAFAAIDYRLVPRHRVEDQAADVAAALAHVLARADSLGIDRSRVVLIGHSAGAHLVALVGTDERYLRGAGLSFADIDGVIPNDGAGYDVPAQLTSAGPRLAETYAQAFGTDRARQTALSPIAHAPAPNAPAFLLLHAARPDAGAQSRALAEALRQAGTEAEVAGFPGEGLRGHMEINRRLGAPDYPATAVVDAWLKKVLGT